MRSQCTESPGRDPASLGASMRATLSRRTPHNRNPAAREAPSLRPGGARSMSCGVPPRDESSRARTMVVPTPMAGERHRPKSSRIRASRQVPPTGFRLAAGPKPAAKRRDTMQDAAVAALGSRGVDARPRQIRTRSCSALACPGHQKPQRGERPGPVRGPWRTVIGIAKDEPARARTWTVPRPVGGWGVTRPSRG